ncbi:hypothetical protein HKD37_04G010169 [Glycine soja]
MRWHKALNMQLDGRIVALVKKFYANLYDPEDKSPRQVRVRGKLIKFDGESLTYSWRSQCSRRALLHFLQICHTHPDPQELASKLCIPGARLVYDLVTKMDMDVRSFISGQISQMAQSNSSWLSFPVLITALCIARGVIPDSLTFESLNPAINLAYIRKNCWNPDDPTITFLGTRNARARGPSDASAPSSSAPSAPASTLAPPAPTPTPPTPSSTSAQSSDAMVPML